MDRDSDHGPLTWCRCEICSAAGERGEGLLRALIPVISTSAANPRKRSIVIDNANRVSKLISDQRWVIPKAPQNHASEFPKA